MHVRPTKPRSALVSAALALTFAAGCGSDDSSSSDSASSSKPKSAELGTPKKASGEPLLFGLLNLEAGPVTFPEYRQAAEAAVSYVNEYKGGIGGRPMKIASCKTDGQPSTSARCAGQILDQKPVAILGGADTGNPGAFEVYKKAKVAYLGGIPFTPVESNAPNAVQFLSVASADLAAATEYVQKQGAKKLSVIYTDDTQGKAGGLGVITPVAKQLGMQVKTVPISPSASDLAAAAASAIESQPDAIFLDSPNACPGLMKALKAVGNTAKILGIDVCVSPPALKTAGDSAEGLIFAQPFPSLDGDDKDTKLFLAAVNKYGGGDVAIDSISQAGFQSVMNIQAALDPIGADKLNTGSILKAFKSGEKPNFMSHPYTCDGKQIATAKSVCNPYQIIKQYKGGKVTAPDGDEYVSAAQYLK